MQWRAAQRGALCLPLCGQRPSFLTLIEPDRLSQRRVFVPANKRVCLQTHTWMTTRGTVRHYCACLCQDRRCLFCPFTLFCFVAPPPVAVQDRLGQTAARDGMAGREHEDQKCVRSERAQRPFRTYSGGETQCQQHPNGQMDGCDRVVSLVTYSGCAARSDCALLQ